MKQRIQKLLAAAGLASRRQAEELIRQGRVTVNGLPCRLGDTADPDTDKILLDGFPVSMEETRVYIMLNKPRGYVSTVSDDRGRRTVLELVQVPQRIYPVGRLDLDSEGLLLLTNDGALTHRLLHPAREISKTYQVWLENASREKIEGLRAPLVLDGYQIYPAKVRVQWLRQGTARTEITIHEGRNRQIRKMAEMCGMNVTRLRRVSEGPLELGELAVGQWRHLSQKELELLGIE